MQIHESYFTKNQGEWNWQAKFQLKSLRALWVAPISIVAKAQVLTLIAAQFCLGSLRMWTRVDVAHLPRKVLHSTKLEKWGFTLYRSEKSFGLDADGKSLLIEGCEYFWPTLSTPVPFEPLRGEVEDSGNRAKYQMPLFGLACDCQTKLEQPLGKMILNSDWMVAEFSLTPESNHKLAMNQ